MSRSSYQGWSLTPSGSSPGCRSSSPPQVPDASIRQRGSGVSELPTLLAGAEAPVIAPEPVRLLIVDDHEVVREGLVAALRDDGRIGIVGVAGSRRAAIELARRTLPHAAVIDMRLQDASGDELCRQLISLI